MSELSDSIKRFMERYPFPSEGFRPVAFFDSRLQQIMVILRDCSYTEIPMVDNLSVFEDNHCELGQGPFVGFIFGPISKECIRRWTNTPPGIATVPLLKIMNVLESASFSPRNAQIRFVFSYFRPIINDIELMLVLE